MPPRWADPTVVHTRIPCLPEKIKINIFLSMQEYIQYAWEKSVKEREEFVIRRKEIYCKGKKYIQVEKILLNSQKFYSISNFYFFFSFSSLYANFIKRRKKKKRKKIYSLINVIILFIGVCYISLYIYRILYIETISE